MYRVLSVLFFALLFSGCHKTEEDIIWEGSFGEGRALCVKTTGDTGYVSVGLLQGKQYLLFLDRDRNKILEYKPDISGALTSVLPCDGYFLTAGISGGKMMLSRIDMTGTVVWDSLFNTSFKVEYASLCRLGGDNFLAVGSADPDSSATLSSGLSFLWFNNSGTIINRKDNIFSTYVAAKAITTDGLGNLFLALSRMGSGGYLKASVAKYNSQAKQIEWEKELYNNPSFGSASLAITTDNSKNPVVTGRTGMQVSTGVESNTFIARYYHTGDSVAKNYLEYSNEGTSVIPDGNGQFYALNRKCLIVNILDQNMSISGIIRTYSSCDPKNTDTSGYSIDITSDGNLIIAGTKGGGYYLAVKSSKALSPV